MRPFRMLPTYLERMERIDDAIEANYEIIKIICEDQQIFVNDDRSTAKVTIWCFVFFGCYVTKTCLRGESDISTLSYML